jgi:NhaA family Na+:H+ antiporter
MTSFNTSPLKSVMKSLQQFVKMESFAGFLLIISSIIALILANSSFAHTYESFINTDFFIGFSSFALKKPLVLWINDGLMAIFFLLIGLEVKREVLEGQLSDWSQIALPGIAAIGGIVVPVLIYTLINQHNPSGLAGWAIPAATDIAFALGVLALLGKRIPNSLKIFLMTLAIFDDLAVIVIIAIFYSTDISYFNLILSSGIIILLIGLNLFRVTHLGPYLLLGVLLWLCVLKSGVHATLAGVVLAFIIPLKVKKSHVSPLKTLETHLHGWVTYFILPLFAFANAGISLFGLSLQVFLNPISLGIILGLFVGKQIGIFLFAYLAIKFKITSLPAHARWDQLYGVAVLCGIGFTISFFISSLTFGETNPEHYKLSRLAILLGSLLSAVTGYLILRFSFLDLKKKSA